ncbi:hypothetical protein ACQP1V_13885 [Microtetraspora malaysiensis]|uniref:hypothetical protein n=1 Tax=Microtetraspora malaysiensis TaxID=161358 RepID=UPI003D8D0D4B
MLKNALATGALVASALVLPVTFSALPANATTASQGEGSGSTSTTTKKAADCWWSNGCKYCRSHGKTRRVTCEHRRGHERGRYEHRERYYEHGRHPGRYEQRERYEHGRHPGRYEQRERYEHGRHPGRYEQRERYEHRGGEHWSHEERGRR